MKIATTDTAPKFAAPKDYQAFASWKTSWESLFATHIVDNPKIQVQIATLTLMEKPEIGGMHIGQITHTKTLLGHGLRIS